MKNNVYIGYLSSPVGLKGEIKVLSLENHLDKIFKIGNCLIIDNNNYSIQSFRLTKNNPIISLKGYDSIDSINTLLKKEIFINRDNLALNKDEYLYSDLENMQVYTDKYFGKVQEVLLAKNNPLIRVNNLLIPLNNHFLRSIDFNKKILYLKHIEELYED